MSRVAQALLQTAFFVDYYTGSTVFVIGETLLSRSLLFRRNSKDLGSEGFRSRTAVVFEQSIGSGEYRILPELPGTTRNATVVVAPPAEPECCEGVIGCSTPKKK